VPRNEPSDPVADASDGYPPCPRSDDRYERVDEGVWAQFVEFHRSRDRSVRNRLIEAHVSLADGIAGRYRRRGVPDDDLRQVALVGLLKAVEGFDPRRGAPFRPFAIPTIRGELRRHFRDHGWTIRVPRRVQELHLQLDTIVSRAGHQLGRAPTIAEVAEAAGTSVEAVLEALEAAEMYRPGSLDAPATDSGITTGELLGKDDQDLGTADTRATIRTLLQELPERERRIVYLRFFEDKTQTEIAAEMGISQMHVSRLLSRSLALLRERERTGS
jgi:RNA polymerase sigma-B factor